VPELTVSEKECQLKRVDASLIVGALREESDWQSKGKSDAEGQLSQDGNFHSNKMSSSSASRTLAVRAFGYTKADRIRNSADYRKLSENGNRWHGRHFIIIYKKNQQSKSRLGITVSKKVGKAVTRNRIKRIIREYYRLNRNLLPIKLDTNVIARRSSGTIGAAAIREQLEYGFLSVTADLEKRCGG
jgi:ribonuclease P protein component